MTTVAEIVQLSFTISASVITAIKTIFAHHGIPETFYSDNGPQYSSKRVCSISQVRMESVKGTMYTIKGMLKKSKDPNFTVFESSTYMYITSLVCTSTSELRIGCMIRCSTADEVSTDSSVVLST